MGNGNARKGRPLSDDNDERGNNDKVAPVSKRARTSGLPMKTDISVEPASPSARSLNSSQRTDRFRFEGSSESKSDAQDQAARDDDPDIARREKLHQRFVRKLGGPECLIGIESRAAEGVGAEYGEDAADDDDEEEPTKDKAKPASKKTATKLTPLEKQVMDIKRKHPDAVLVVEVGYKFRFFGEDARTAAKELSIVCIPGKMRFDERMEKSLFFR